MEDKHTNHVEQPSHPEYRWRHDHAEDEEKARQDAFQLRQEYHRTMMIYAQTVQEHRRQVHDQYLALLNHRVADGAQALEDYHEAVRDYRIVVQHYLQRVRDYRQTEPGRSARLYRPRH